jgi:hypothetical protein
VGSRVSTPDKGARRTGPGAVTPHIRSGCAESEERCILRFPASEVFRMIVAGVEISDSEVLKLAHLLRDAGFGSTALHLERAFDFVAHALPLSSEDRDAISAVLEHSDDDLAKLRDLLAR